jgi:DNA primase catalytic core
MNLKLLSDNARLKSQNFAEIVGACKFLLRNLPEAKEFSNYIEKRLSSFSINKFGVGYFPSNERLDSIVKFVDKDILLELSLIYRKYRPEKGCVQLLDIGHLSYHNLVFPFKDEYGNIVGLIGRSILSDEERKSRGIPKYKNTYYNKSLHLFGLYQAKKAILKNQSAILVEGQIDCINCHANGFNNVVALGGSSLSFYQLFLLKKYTNKIYLLLDNDDSGLKGEQSIIRNYSKEINIEKIKLPSEYKDVDQYLKNSKTYNIFDI